MRLAGDGGCSLNLYHLQAPSCPEALLVGLKLDDVGTIIRGREGESAVNPPLFGVESRNKLAADGFGVSAEGSLGTEALIGDRLDGCNGPGRERIAGRLAVIRRGCCMQVGEVGVGGLGVHRSGTGERRLAANKAFDLCSG